MNAKRTINSMDCTIIYSKDSVFFLCKSCGMRATAFFFQEFPGKEAFLGGYLWRDICSGRILQKT